MKILILTCLVALALGRDTEPFIVSTESLELRSNYEDSTKQINKPNLENVEREEQHRENEFQDKIYPLSQPQPLVYPYTDPFLPQNILSPAQLAVTLPFLPRHKGTPFSESLEAPALNLQTLNLSDLENLPLPLSVLQLLIQQFSQPLLQTPVLPSRPWMSLYQPQGLPVPQQVLTQPQRPFQTLLLSPNPALGSAREFNPWTKTFGPLYHPIVV